MQNTGILKQITGNQSTGVRNLIDQSKLQFVVQVHNN